MHHLVFEGINKHEYRQQVTLYNNSHSYQHCIILHTNFIPTFSYLLTYRPSKYIDTISIHLSHITMGVLKAYILQMIK